MFLCASQKERFDMSFMQIGHCYKFDPAWPCSAFCCKYFLKNKSDIKQTVSFVILITQRVIWYTNSSSKNLSKHFLARSYFKTTNNSISTKWHVSTFPTTIFILTWPILLSNHCFFHLSPLLFPSPLPLLFSMSVGFSYLSVYA